MAGKRGKEVYSPSPVFYSVSIQLVSRRLDNSQATWSMAGSRYFLSGVICGDGYLGLGSGTWGGEW